MLFFLLHVVLWFGTAAAVVAAQRSSGAAHKYDMENMFSE